MTRVLVVEDEPDLSTLLVYNLRHAGYEVDSTASGATAITRLSTFHPRLILLDLMLPDINGLDVIRTVRASPEHARTAVVMLTARGSEQDRVTGFELGADDYIVKPFSIKEVLLRLQAVLRRGEPELPGGILVHGPVRVDPSRHEASVQGTPLVLTALEFRLLKTLLERPGRIQSREALLSDVWGIQAEIETRTVDTHIKRLRQKLGPAGWMIQTLRGVGYRLSDQPGGTDDEL